MINHWSRPVIDRQQIALFAPTLDAFVQENHPVRMVDEILRQIDFGPWEQEYDQFIGQPPIHPRVLAGVLLLRDVAGDPLQPEAGGLLWQSPGLHLADGGTTDRPFDDL